MFISSTTNCPHKTCAKSRCNLLTLFFTKDHTVPKKMITGLLWKALSTSIHFIKHALDFPADLASKNNMRNTLIYFTTQWTVYIWVSQRNTLYLTLQFTIGLSLPHHLVQFFTYKFFKIVLSFIQLLFSLFSQIHPPPSPPTPSSFTICMDKGWFF